MNGAHCIARRSDLRCGRVGTTSPRSTDCSVGLMPSFATVVQQLPSQAYARSVATLNVILSVHETSSMCWCAGGYFGWPLENPLKIRSSIHA